MKILQVGDNDLYCRKFAGHDLHLYLNEIGQNSSHLVWEKLSKDSKTKVIADRREDREEIYNATKIIRSKYGLDSIQNPIVFDILYDPLFLRTDIVHYHLIHNHIFDISFFPLMSKLKPTV